MVEIRNARPEEHRSIGQMMVEVYSGLDGFPKPEEQPGYYQMLANVGALSAMPETEIIVAVSEGRDITGAVVYFGDMQYYGSGGTATKQKHASGFRLLAVPHVWRGRGIGKLLTQECIRRANTSQKKQVLIHSTHAMRTAWSMYERIGFQRAEDLDFMQGTLPVYGFRLVLKQALL